MDIIRQRLVKAIKVTNKSSKYYRRSMTKNRRLRGSNKQELCDKMHIAIQIDLKEKVDELAKVLGVTRSIIFREAIRMYIWMAEQEKLLSKTLGEELKVTPTQLLDKREKV